MELTKDVVLDLEQVTKLIKKDQFVPVGKWEYKSIQPMDTKDTTWGKLYRFIFTIKHKPDKYERTLTEYQVNYYYDEHRYVIYYNGTYLE